MLRGTPLNGQSGHIAFIAVHRCPGDTVTHPDRPPGEHLRQQRSARGIVLERIDDRGAGDARDQGAAKPRGCCVGVRDDGERGEVPLATAVGVLDFGDRGHQIPWK